MAIEIRQVGPCFAGEVEGLDMTQPLSSDDADAIHAGMERGRLARYAGVVFGALAFALGVVYVLAALV